MGKLLWLIGGTALAVAVFSILNAPDPVPADGVERTAGRVGAWGTKQRVGGTGDQLVGKAKEVAGGLVGSNDTQSEGVLDQAAGSVRNAAGQAAQALGQTIHDLNQN